MTNKHKRHQIYARALSIALALIVGISFMPLLGSDAYSASETPGQNAKEKLRYVEKLPDGTEVEIDESELPNADNTLNNFSPEDINISAEPEDVEVVTAPEDSLPGYSELAEVLDAENNEAASGLSAEDIEEGAYDEPSSDDSADEAEVATPDEDSENGILSALAADDSRLSAQAAITRYAFNITQPDAGGSINVSCTLTADSTGTSGRAQVLIDGSSSESYTWNDARSKTITLNDNINIRGLAPGVHSVRVRFQLTGASVWAYTDYNYFASSVYDAPSASGSIEVYSTYFNYMAPLFDFVAVSRNYRLYMDYASVSNYGPMTYVQNYTMGGLTPNSVFGAQIFYGTIVTYDGQNYFLNGKDTGSVRGIGTFRAGIAKLPKIKSIKVKAYKVKKRRAGVYGWYTGYYFGSVKYYTYKIKVTVQFKKKPKLNGIYINGVWKKGRKKKYTLKLGSYANYTKPRGKKFNVYVYSAHSPGGYGGYSPMYSKRKKVK